MDNKISADIIPFFLVTGFLGSGKTTFLKNILARYAGDKRIAVIQNEFASAGIDGIDLKMTGAGFRLVEINNGSVFCICLMATFAESVRNIIDEYKPEMIILEASGLSDPVNIIELLGREGLNGRVGLAKVTTIVDAPNFEKGLRTFPRFRHQVMIADTVLINKSDVFEGSSALLHDQIREMNPFAAIIETAYCKTDLKSLIPGTMQKAASAFAGKKPGGRPEINACVLRAHEKMPPGGLRSFIKELQETSPRIKGFINMKNGDVMAVQTVYEHCEINPVAGYEGPSELIAFGRGLTPRYLRDKFKKYAL